MDALAVRNLTREQLKECWIEIQGQKEWILVLKDKRLPLDLSHRTKMLYFNQYGDPPISFDLDTFLSKTMKNILNDSSFIPLKIPDLNWTSRAICKLESLNLSISQSSLSLFLNKIQVLLRNINQKKNSQQAYDQRMLLVVINTETCLKTLETVVQTDSGGYRNLLWQIETIAPNRMVVLSSMKSGFSIDKNTLNVLEQFGFVWDTFFRYGDVFIQVFYKGGKILIDTIVPSIKRNEQFLSNSLSIYLNGNLQESFQNECSSWPTTKPWKDRKIFCQNYDGYGNLCNCENPFVIKEKINNDIQQLPIVILTGERTRFLYRLLESLVSQEHVTRQMLLIVCDGYVEETARLASILNLSLVLHKPEGSDSVRISRNLRFALFTALKVFQQAESFIILEDDLLLSPDFYSFMIHIEPIFDKDHSIFCVSAFNYIAYMHTSTNASLLYRVQSYPAYGWMMPKKIIEEVLPKWLPPTFGHDWDSHMQSDIVRRDRECIVPDINRSFHWSFQGMHFTNQKITERVFLSRNYNQDTNITLLPNERLLKNNYEKEMESLVKSSIPVQSKKDLDDRILKGKTYGFYFHCNEKNISSVRRLAFEFDIWSLDFRDSHNYSWRFTYRNATIFFICFPSSIYSSYKPLNYTIIVGEDIMEDETFGKLSNSTSEENYTALEDRNASFFFN